jgi:histidine triad (HIT) family protein
MQGGRRFVTKILSCSAVVQSTSSFIVTSNPLRAVGLSPFLSPLLTSTASTLLYSTTTALAMSTSDEVQMAAEAAKTVGDGSAPTIFDKIISGEIPSNKIHDDDLCIAFRDVNPQAPVHFLVIPKNRDGLTQLSKAREDQKALLGHMMYVAQELAQKECPGGFRIVINDGKDGAQSVYHLHLHGESIGRGLMSSNSERLKLIKSSLFVSLQSWVVEQCNGRQVSGPMQRNRDQNNYRIPHPICKDYHSVGNFELGKVIVLKIYYVSMHISPCPSIPPGSGGATTRICLWVARGIGQSRHIVVTRHD